MGLSDGGGSAFALRLFGDYFVWVLQVDIEGVEMSRRWVLLELVGWLVVCGSVFCLTAAGWSVFAGKMENIGPVVILMVWFVAFALIGVVFLWMVRREASRRD